MFFDTNTSQSNNQTNNTGVKQLFNPNNNTNFSISIGGDVGDSDMSTSNDGTTDFGNFTPSTKNTTEQTASTDLGISAGVAVGDGAEASGGEVAMSKATSRMTEDVNSLSDGGSNSNTSNNPFNPYLTTAKGFFDSTQNILLTAGAVAVVGGGVFLIKKKKKK